jgi:hypothetical protein
MGCDCTHLRKFFLAHVLGLNRGAVNAVFVKYIFHLCSYFHEIRLFQTQHVHAADQLVVNQGPHVEFVHFDNSRNLYSHSP